jgi:superfamily I DNA and/or RNA helicase
MVLTFYKEQFQRLVQIGEEEGLQHPLLRIATVDSAQGSEADVVILSCVRSNGAVGFLSNRNRLCVAFSRAREWLCVFGHSATLRSDEVWRGLHDSSAASRSFHRLVVQHP